MSEYHTIKIALLGAGSVGAQVARLLLEQRAEFAARTGAKLELIGIAVRNLESKRDVELPQQLFTLDAAALIAEADLVIEVMGGTTLAKTLILQALNAGKSVVTANKALLATAGSELQAAAKASGAQLSFEAAVAGAIPVLRPLMTSLAGDNVRRVMGIVNGSTNYILDSMHRFGKTTAEAMQIASDLGYLEADPTLDVEGFDAAQKAAILARLAFHTEFAADAVYREGITAVSAADVAYAKANKQVIKLLAIIEKITRADGTPAVSARVHPALIAESHPLAAVQGGKNAIFVEAESAGELMFYGAGAGGVETASAVLGDVIETTRRIVLGGSAAGLNLYTALPALPPTEILTAYQLCLRVTDVTAAFAAITQAFAKEDVQLVNISLGAKNIENNAQMLFVTTAKAQEAKHQAVLQTLQTESCVLEVVSKLRSEVDA